MTIKIDELQKKVSILLFKIQESKGNEIELKNDFYWDISANEKYNPCKAPKEMTIGQLSSDYDLINRFSLDDDATPYDLKRVAEIIATIGIENNIAF